MRLSNRQIISDLKEKIKDLKNSHKKELEKEMLLTIQKKHTVYVDGVIAHPFIMEYCIVNKVRPIAFGVLILMCTLKEIRLSTLIKYGFRKSPTHQALTYLIEMGLAEKFGGHLGIYTPSLNGRKLFFNYKLFYCEGITKNIYNESDQTKFHRWPK